MVTFIHSPNKCHKIFTKYLFSVVIGHSFIFYYFILTYKKLTSCENCCVSIIIYMQVLINIFFKKSTNERLKKKKKKVALQLQCHLNKPKQHCRKRSKTQGNKMAHYTKRGTVETLPLFIQLVEKRAQIDNLKKKKRVHIKQTKSTIVFTHSPNKCHNIFIKHLFSIVVGYSFIFYFDL